MLRKELAINSLINLSGSVIPLAVGLVTIPRIVEGLGIERFGLLTLAWAIIGYFSLFDMGISRAMTQLIAEKIGNAQESDVSKIAWTGLLMMSIFGLVGAIFIALLCPWFISSFLNVSEHMKDEAIWAFIMLSAAIPAVVLSYGFSGVLAAIQRFDLINILRIPMGIMIFMVPLAILPYSQSTAVICAGLMIIRIIFMVLHAVACFHALPILRSHVAIDISKTRKLLSFGGWMTTTNIIGPLMVYIDRFAIGALMSVSAVAYYVTPYEIVSRLLAAPAAIVTVLFPAFAASKRNHTDSASSLYSMGGRAILAILAPVVLLLVVFANEGLNVWIGSDFSQKSTTVLQWLVIGVFFNSYAQVPFAFIQGFGRADITARLHLLELPIYLALMFWFLNAMGILGVAIAFLLRCALDAVLMTLMAHRLKKETAFASRQILPMLVTPVFLFAIGMMIDEITGKILFTIFGFTTLMVVGYYLVVTSEERIMIRKYAYSFFRENN